MRANFNPSIEVELFKYLVQEFSLLFTLLYLHLDQLLSSKIFNKKIYIYSNVKIVGKHKKDHAHIFPSIYFIEQIYLFSRL